MSHIRSARHERILTSVRLSFVLALLLPVAGTLARGAQFILTWSDNSTNESGFRLERAPGRNATSGFAQIASVGANVERYVDSGLPNSTSYSYRLRAYNAAGSSAYSNVASGTTPPPSSNTAPTITDIADQIVNLNGTTGALAFRISDTQTAASSLTLIRNSSNKTLVPLANITFGGSGNNRTVTVRPATNQRGYSTIWIKVSDGSLSSYISFMVTVNTAPTISSINDRTIVINGTTGAIPFTIGDGQTSASSLTLVKNVSNTTLIPLANVTFGGSGANRTVTVRPSSNRTGWSTVWVKVSDGRLTSDASFVVQVAASLTYTQIESTSGVSTSLLQADSSTAGADGVDDRLVFGYTPLTGDVELTTRVESLPGTSDEWRGGLMLRASTAADAACAGVYVSGAGRLLFVSRATAGGTLQTVAPLPGRAPRLVRLVRTGGTVYGFTSVDGNEWDLVEFAPVTLPSTVLGGTAAEAPSGGDAHTVGLSALTVD